jgi:hypothetical protein
MADKVGEAREILDTIGQDSEKEGIRWTKIFMDQWDKKEWEENQIEKEKLKKRNKRRLEYTHLLHNLIREKGLELERPAQGYWLETGFNQKGVWVRLHDRHGNKWNRGIKVTGIPKYDHHAALILVQAIEDKMWELEENPQTKSGIYLS